MSWSMSETYQNLTLIEQWQNYSCVTIEELDKYIAKALNTSAQIAVNSVKAQLSSTLPKLSSSSGLHGYTRPLAEGVQKRNVHINFMKPYSSVTILGSKSDDGTWRLRFFSIGTKIDGKQKIQPNNFFESGFNASVSSIESNIQTQLKDFENIVNTQQ